MSSEYIIRILKYAVLTFTILIMTVIVIGYNYNAKGLMSMALGQNWYMVFEYKKKNDSFIIYFGYLSLIVPIAVAIISDNIVRLFNRRKVKLNKSQAL